MPANRPSSETWIGLAALAFAAVVLVPELIFPLARDQGVFACVAERMLHGALPYRDVWDIKPPPIYLIYAAILGALGRSALAIHAADLITALLVSSLLYRLARRAGAAAAAGAAVWYAALYLRGTFWSLAQAESFANVPLALAALLVAHSCCDSASPVRPRANGWRLFLAGALAGSASACKLTLALPAAAIVVFGLVAGRRGRNGAAVAQQCLLVAAGAVTPLLLVFAWMQWSGCLSAYVEIQKGFVQGYAALTGDGRGRSALALSAGYLHGILLPLALAAAALSAARVARRRTPHHSPAPFITSLGLVWLLAAYASVLAQRKFFWYHWTAALPPLALLAGIGADAAIAWLARSAAIIVASFRRYRLSPDSRSAELARPPEPKAEQARHSANRALRLEEVPAEAPPLRAGNRRHSATRAGARADRRPARSPVIARRSSSSDRSPNKRSASWAWLLTTAIPLAWSLVGRWPTYHRSMLRATGDLHRDAYVATFGRPGGGDFSPLADEWVARYLRARTSPADGVFIWGFEPLVYFLADRWPPTRFVFNVPQTYPGGPREWRDELVRDLHRRPPAVFLVVRHDAVPWASGSARDSAAELQRFPELRRFLGECYRPESVIEDFTLYRRR